MVSSNSSPSPSSDCCATTSTLSKPHSRQSNRACDACAIRKVRCGPVKPCAHCVTNKLQCTQLRQRKKSGPKNLHKKTLASINNLIKNESTPGLSDSIPSTIYNSPVPASVTPVPSTNNHQHSLLEPSMRDINEIFGLLSSNSVMVELLDTLTVSSLLVDPIQLMENCSNLLLNNLLNQSLRLVVYSLLLVILENMFRMIESNDDSILLRNPISHYKQVQSNLLIYINELSVALETEMRLSIEPIDSKVYYNHSLTCLHLHNYHQISRGRSTSRNSRFLTLRSAITYLQLLEPTQLALGQFYELHELLFIAERMASCFISESIKLSHNNNNITNHSHTLIAYPSDCLLKGINLEMTKSLDTKNQLYSLLQRPEIENHLGLFKFFNNANGLFNQISDSFRAMDMLTYCASHGITPMKLARVIEQLNQCELEYSSVSSSCLLIFINILVAKIDTAKSTLEERKFSIPPRLLNHIQRINLVLKGTDLATLIVRSSHLQLIPQLLTMLRMVIELNDHRQLSSSDRHLLVDFTRNLIILSPSGYDLDPYVRGSPVLCHWFSSLSQSSEVQSNSNNTPNNSNNTTIVDSSSIQVKQEFDDTQRIISSSGTSSAATTIPPSIISNIPSPGGVGQGLSWGEQQVDPIGFDQAKNLFDVFHPAESNEDYEMFRNTSQNNSNSISDLFSYYTATA
ncbi:hypothetical protein CAAN1_05S03994 [[Candida] anglica]|uniref:Zn(2)-C6 fungal-type domain-containing protein n=1 Tax=[Candida] anglica TaxID=148631 RepID=A0ABP0ED32_9ASCO